MSKLFYFRGTKRDTTRVVLTSIEHEEIDIESQRGLVSLTRKIMSLGIGKGDVTLIDSWGRAALILVLVKKIKGFRTVIRLRGDPYFALEQRERWLLSLKKQMMRFLLRNADVLIFNSRYVKDRSEYREFRNRAEIVYNPLMTSPENVSLDIAEQTRISSKPFRLLSVTNFDYRAKIEPLTHALRHWITQGFLEKNNIEWTIIGDGHHFDDFREEFAKEPVSDRVRIYGYRSSVGEFYESHHVFVHLSGFDSLPNVALEAAIYELPIITVPESGGTLEAMRDGHTGAIVSDNEGFQNAILKYRNAPERRAAHGRNGRDLILSEFTIERQKMKMVDVLKDRFDGFSR